MWLKPPYGHRTFILLQQALVVGCLISMVGIWQGVDLFNLSILIAAVLMPVVGSQAYKSVWTPRDRTHKASGK